MTLHGKQAELIAIPVIFPVLAILLVGFRLRARVITREPYKANDYLIVVATVTTVAGSVAFVIAASTTCLDSDGCSEDRIALWEKTFFIFQLLYIVSVSCIKVSILLFYKRIFQSRRFTQAVWAVVAVVALWGVAFFFSYLVGIWPISSRWNIINANASWEIDLDYYYIANSATDVLMDLITLCLPLPMIRRLRMSGRNKLALLGAFALGFFASIAGVMRMIYAIKLDRANGIQDYSADEDASTNLVIWSTLEPCMGIICACLPLLHPYFKRHSPEAIVGANSAGYGVIHGRDSVHRDPKGLSIYMSHISDHHENVIE